MNLERWNDLKKRYAEMEDIELQRLRATYDDLTPEGQDALKREMDTRGLPWDAASPATPPVQAVDLSGYTPDERHRILATGGVALDIPSDETGFAAWMFMKYGVEYGTMALNQYDAALAVAPEDVDRAYQLLAQTSDNDKAEYEEWSSADAPLIACPACASEDVMVESVDADGNSEWLCNSCQHHWKDADMVPEQA